MSERLWVGTERAAWATVNVCDHPSDTAAILAFCRHYGQHLKVSGPSARLVAVWSLWQFLANDENAMFEEWIPDPEEASWFALETPESSGVAWAPP